MSLSTKIIDLIIASDASEEAKAYAQHVVLALIEPREAGASNAVISIMAGKIAESFLIQSMTKADINKASEICTRLGLKKA